MDHVLLHVLGTYGGCGDRLCQCQHLRAEFILATNRITLQHSVPTMNFLHGLTPLLLDLIELLLVLLLPLGSSFRHFPQ
jgi:hypothetical protein